VIGRDAEIQRATEILARKTKRNPLLIGEPGVGKTAIAMGVALKIVAGGQDLPHQLRNKRIFSIEMGHVLKGTSLRGSLEDNLMNAIDEAAKYGDILFIDELHTIIGAGKTKDSEMDAAQMLKTKLATGELSCIGATTWKEYREKLSRDGAIERRFRTIMVHAPSVSDTIKILLGLKADYEEHHDVKISDAAVEAAARLSNRYITDKQMPDKAIDLMDEASVLCALECTDDAVETPIVGVEHVEQIISRETRIPLDRLREGEQKKLLELESRMGTRVVGQKDALKALAQAVRRARAGVQDPERPIGSFLFQGPTGVGKTETSRALANFLLDNEEALERLDMSEYMEKNSVTRLIGANPGYVGYEGGGLLTEAVRKRPYCVLLFDEIEKAHPDVFNVLLQVLDYGKLTDAQGRQVDFRNVIIICTTNCGAQKNDQFGFNHKSQSGQQRGLEAIKKTFTPEFLNRLDGIIYFDRLTMPEVRQIVDIRLTKLNSWLAEQSIRVELTDDAKAILAEAGWSEEYGARELNRTIQRMIQDPLAERILSSKCKTGDTVEFDVSNDNQLAVTEAELALAV
jgi:ATP-dependent Clp protease ATP-binding subunit ClpC